MHIDADQMPSINPKSIQNPDCRISTACTVRLRSDVRRPIPSHIPCLRFPIFFLEERLTESNIGIQIANFGPNVVRPRSCSTVFLIIPTLLLRQ